MTKTYFGYRLEKIDHGCWIVRSSDGDLIEVGVHSRAAAEAVVKMHKPQPATCTQWVRPRGRRRFRKSRPCKLEALPGADRCRQHRRKTPIGPIDGSRVVPYTVSTVTNPPNGRGESVKCQHGS